MTTGGKVLLSLGALALILLIFKSSFGEHDSFIDLDHPDSAQPTIFSGVESRFGFQANLGQAGGGSYQTTLITYNWVFLPSGKMYKILPQDGDVAGYCDHPESNNPCLSYVEDGNSVTITNSDGSTTSYDINDDSLTLKKGVVLKKALQVTSEAIAAKWHRSNYAQSAGYGGTVGASSAQEIYFDTDGNFANHNFSGFTGSGALAGGYGSRQTIEQGTYTLDGYFITLKYQDGFEAKHVIFKYPDEDVLSLDGRNFIQ